MKTSCLPATLPLQSQLCMLCSDFHSDSLHSQPGTSLHPCRSPAAMFHDLSAAQVRPVAVNSLISVSKTFTPGSTSNQIWLPTLPSLCKRARTPTQNELPLCGQTCVFNKCVRDFQKTSKVITDLAPSRSNRLTMLTTCFLYIQAACFANLKHHILAKRLPRENHCRNLRTIVKQSLHESRNYHAALNNVTHMFHSSGKARRGAHDKTQIKQNHFL